MEINLSNEVIEAVYNSLRSSKHDLKRQLENNANNTNKREIIKHQINDVENALQVFEELIELI